MLQIAALMMFALGLAHSVLGERYILVRLFKRSDLPKLFGGTAFTTRTLRFTWHITTVLWWGIAFLLWKASTAPLTQPLVLQVVGITSILCGLLPLLITRGRHFSWIFLFAIGFICLAQSGVALP